MSFITILTRTLLCASVIAIAANILVINGSATLGEQVSTLDSDLKTLTRVNDELNDKLSSLYDIKRIAQEAQLLGFTSANTAMTVTVPDPLAMQP